MKEKPNFAEYKAQLNGMGEKERLAKILSDVGCTFPVFYGTVSRHGTIIFINRIKQIGQTDSITFPYQTDDDKIKSPAVIVNPAQIKSTVSDNDTVLLTLNVGTLSDQKHLLRADRVVLVKDIFEKEIDCGQINTNNLSELNKVINKLCPFGTGILLLDEVIDKYNNAISEIYDMREAIGNCEENIKEFSNIKNAIGDPEKFQEFIKVVAKTIDDWNSASIPSLQDLNELSKVCERVKLQVKRTLGSTIAFELKAKELSEIKESIGNLEEINNLVSGIGVAIEKWESSGISSQNELNSWKKSLEHLQHEADEATKTIREYRNEVVGLRSDVDAVYPWFSDRFDFDRISKDSIKTINASTTEDVLSRMKYEYDADKVNMFISALNTTQIIALCGKPGTGKTTFAEQISKGIGAAFRLIEVQNNWTDRSDILGFYNPTNNTYQSTDFLEAILAAKDEYERNQNKSRIYVICLDEMNLSRVEYYFATFLSILQRPEDQRRITLLPRDVEISLLDEGSEKMPALVLLKRYQSFLLPPNIRFVGTMNMDDTAQFLSPKVIDRSIFIEFIESNEKDEYEINKRYNENVLDAYYLCEEFRKNSDPSDTIVSEEKIEIRKHLKSLSEDSVFTPTNRIYDQSNRMWEVYRCLRKGDKNALTSFVDLIILGKVLPSLTRRFVSLSGADNTEKLDGYKNSKTRYLYGIRICSEAHPYSTQNWSFWE